MITIEVRKKDLNLFNKDWWRSTRVEWAPKLLIENRKKWPSQVDPSGRPWKSLTPSYDKWKRKNFGSLPILRLTGEMLDRASIEVDDNQFFVKSSDAGFYHQFGTRKMSARPWVGIPDKSLGILSQIALKNILL